MCGGNVGLGGLGAVGTGADAGTGGGIGAGASVAGLEICPPVSGGDPPAPFVGGNICGEEDGNSSKEEKGSDDNFSIFYLRKYYSHLRARGGGVEDSKSIDSASEPCCIKITKLLKKLFF